jgi:hypothetical protein
MKIAIQGHKTRGKEVIRILENLGGINSYNYLGSNPNCYYEIHGNTIVCTCTKSNSYKYYILEEFEKEFPFKIGDKVVCKATQQILHTIVGISLDSFACMQYKIKEDKTGIITHCPTNLLIKYKEMKEERNITLTLDKAKEWYKKGGELKEIALQAFTEKELTKVDLPKTWEEYTQQHFHREGYVLTHLGDIAETTITGSRGGENLCPSKKSAEAHLAMIQLEQLRDCWRNGWEPEWNNSEKYVIKWEGDSLRVFTAGRIHAFLAFPTREMAKEFQECFRDLIEKAGDLI